MLEDKGRKEERSKQGQTNHKAKQHSTPKAVTFPKKNELPRVGLQPETLHTLDRVLMYTYIYMHAMHQSTVFMCLCGCGCRLRDLTSMILARICLNLIMRASAFFFSKLCPF